MNATVKLPSYFYKGYYLYYYFVIARVGLKKARINLLMLVLYFKIKLFIIFHLVGRLNISPIIMKYLPILVNILIIAIKNILLKYQLYLSYEIYFSFLSFYIQLFSILYEYKIWSLKPFLRL